MKQEDKIKFEKFLKLLRKEGYPNEDTSDLAAVVGYNLDNFLIDFVEVFGMDKMMDFVEEGLKKLIGKDKKVTLTMSDSYGLGSFVDLKIKDFYIDLDDTADGIRLNASFGDSAIEDPEGILKSLDDISDEIGIGEWGDFEELIENIKHEFQDWFYKRLGYQIYWE